MKGLLALGAGRPDYSEPVKAEAVRLVGQGMHPGDVRRHIFHTFGCSPGLDTIRKWWTERGASS